MNPVKNLVPIAKWFLRISAAIVIYNMHFELAATFDFNSLNYFLALGIVVAAITLIVGGFTKNNVTTVVSGLVICAISVVLMFIPDFSLYSILGQFVPASLGFYFLARGNHG